jgi:ACT domain-containing protein
MPTNKLMVHVYLSQEEKSRVEKAAKNLGISISAYTKVKMFGGKDL